MSDEMSFGDCICRPGAYRPWYCMAHAHRHPWRWWNRLTYRLLYHWSRR